MGTMIRRVLLLFALLAACSMTPAWAQNKLAFVVGINSYPNLRGEAQLERAVADANAVADTLQKLGFAVERLTDDKQTQEVFLNRFSAFSDKIREGDTVIVYYSGHGVGLAGANYLIPADIPSNLGSPQLLRARAIAEADLIAAILAKKAQVTITVIDACRNNPFPSRSLGLTRGFERVEAPEGVLSIYSAGFGQEALDRLPGADPSPNSVFTRVFVEDLKKPGLNLVDLGESVRDDVAALAKTADFVQVPAVYNQVLGARRIYLAGLPPSQAPAQAPPSPDESTWNFVKATRDPAIIRRFIDGFPASAKRAEAEALLASLAKGSVAPPPIVPAPPAVVARPPQQAPAAQPVNPVAPAKKLVAKPVPPLAKPKAKPAAQAAVNRPPSPSGNGGCFTFNGERFCN
jgi:hypothetical protein